MMPVKPTIQYLLSWYIAETLPPDLEASLSAKTRQENGAYQYPPPFPKDLTLAERADLESSQPEPMRHENTGVDEEETLYESYLLPIDTAQTKLKGTIMADVVRLGWEAVCSRREMERKGSVG